MSDDRKKSIERKIWDFIGIIFGYIAIIAFIQKGVGGYVIAYGGLLLVLGIVFLLEYLGKQAFQFIWRIAAISILSLWLYIGGSYSLPRDILILALTCGISLLVWPNTRMYLFSLLQNKLDGGQAAPLQSPQYKRFSISWVVIAWLSITAADTFFESKELPLNGNIPSPDKARIQWLDKKIGLSLSGGGYRAALLHAGVLHELANQGVAVTHLSAVSGGAIIAAYVARGGKPEDFFTAVQSRRFNLTRDMTWAHNLIRLPAPAYSSLLDLNLWPFSKPFSRLNVQENLLDRVLLGGIGTMELASKDGPELMICMTDLTYGLNIGAMSDGFLMLGPSTSRYFDSREARFPDHFDRLSTRVAISGAFPVAFPTTPVTAHISLTDPGTSPSKKKQLDLLLADGGIRDNLGLRLLQKANEYGWMKDSHPLADWKLDLMLVSDGGKFFRQAEATSQIDTALRAIDITGLETGFASHTPQNGVDTLPPVMLSATSILVPLPDAQIQGLDLEARKNASFNYFRPQRFKDNTLTEIVSLVPDTVRAEKTLADYRRLSAPGGISLTKIENSCTAEDTEPQSLECAWWSLVQLVGEDIWSALQIFMSTPTLQDSFAPLEADGIFRLGRYFVLLSWPEIEEQLERASQ